MQVNAAALRLLSHFTTIVAAKPQLQSCSPELMWLRSHCYSHSGGCANAAVTPTWPVVPMRLHWCCGCIGSNVIYKTVSQELKTRIICYGLTWPQSHYYSFKLVRVLARPYSSRSSRGHLCLYLTVPDHSRLYLTSLWWDLDCMSGIQVGRV